MKAVSMIASLDLQRMWKALKKKVSLQRKYWVLSLQLIFRPILLKSYVLIAINSFMATTEDILTDLPFFGNPSETQLLAIQNLSRQGIEGVSRQVFNSMQSAMVSGLSSGLRGEQLKDLMRNSINTNVPRSENIIGTLLGDYRRSVIAAMAFGLP